ncbi:hypothetical protein ACFQ8T_19905 [Isoptericola sp. NPDC056618]|uniref:hypothetical protein n=1 Tax=Isoptericola sp. NPDC056618 TaxID=3345878 RepID=UPI0036AA7465
MTPVAREGGGPGGRLAPPAGELRPLPGSPPALVDAAAVVERVAAGLEDSRTRLLRVRSALDGQRSTAVERARERVTAAGDAARTSGGMLEAAAATLRRHAATLGDAQAAAQRALALRADALGREARWQAEADEARRSTWNIAAAGGAAPGAGEAGAARSGTAWPGAAWSGAAWSGAPALPADPARAHLRLAAAEREVAAARADVAAAEARWRAARETKDEASRQAAAALASLADVRAVRSITAAGADPAGFQASGEAARSVVALLPRATSGGDAAARRAVRDDLRHVLTAHADDPAFWAVFWDDASPAQLYEALVPRGPGAAGVPAGLGGALGGALGPALDVELARALGAGIGLWAQTASPAEQGDLGRRVVGDVAAGAGSPLTPADRAEVAVALLPASLPAAVHAGADDALDAWWSERAPLDGSFTVLAPLVVAVAAGLAAHPRLAFDRLAPADEGLVGPSVARWLGSVPRAGWPDGGRAVAHAFATAVDVGAASPDRGDQARAALLVSHATEALPVGLLRTPGLADDAAGYVAVAYEPYVPVIGDVTQAQNPTSGKAGVEPVPAPGVDPDAEVAPDLGNRVPLVVQPELDVFALRDVIGATSRTPGAAAAWLGVTDRYAGWVLEQATSEGFDEDSGPRVPLVQEALSDIGGVTGGMQAQTIDTARAQVDTRETVLALAGTGVGYLRFGSRVVTEAVGLASGPALSLFDPEAPLDDARERIWSTEHGLIDRYATDLYDGVVQHDLGLGLTPDAAAERSSGLTPDGNGSTPATLFDASFDHLSDPAEDDR